MLTQGLSTAQIVLCLQEELDLTADEAALALADADTPPQGLHRLVLARRPLVAERTDAVDVRGPALP